MKTKKVCTLITAITASVALAILLFCIVVVATNSRELFTMIYESILNENTVNPSAYIAPEDAFALTRLSMVIVFVSLSWECIMALLVAIFGFIAYGKLSATNSCKAFLIVSLVASVLGGSLLWIILIAVAMATKSGVSATNETVAPKNIASPNEQVERLRKMRDDGVITESEYIDMLSRIVK